MNETPLLEILCGPILRRIEPSKVFIWIATSQRPLNMSVNVFELIRNENNWDEELVSTETKHQVIQVGINLFVNLLEVLPKDGKFKQLQPFGYDIVANYVAPVLDEETGIIDYKNIALSETLEFNSIFCYADLPYPVFVIPDQNESNSRIFYGSCRKTQGPGSDALNGADKELDKLWQEYPKSKKNRIPDFSLFHLGDQIYADDLSEEVFEMVRILSSTLMGYEEKIPNYLTPKFISLRLTIPTEFTTLKDLSNQDLSSFLLSYLKGYPNYFIEDLNLPTVIIYETSDTKEKRRKNIHCFLHAFFRVTQINPLLDAYISNLKKFVRIRSVLGYVVSKFFDDQPVLTDKDVDVWLDSSDLDLIDNINIRVNEKNLPLIELNEVLPRKYLSGRVSPNEVFVKDIKYGERRAFLRVNSSISTDDKGHMLTIGEFAALYLLNWTQCISLVEDVILKKALQDLEQLNPSISLKGGLKSEKERYSKFINKYLKPENENIEGLLNGNARTIRLFANVPSYMIFDDHEVTDEWNCDDIWKDRVEKSITGKRLVSNALAAYFVFQAWGNCPDSFSPEFINKISAHFKNLIEMNGSDEVLKAKSLKPSDEITKDFEDMLWSYNKWSFTTPTNPVAVFMDNRTARFQDTSDSNYYLQLNENKKYKAARLMSPDAYKVISELLNKADYKKNNPIIFCAPTPIIASKLFLSGQLKMVDGSFNANSILASLSPMEPGRYKNDYEFWQGNPMGKYDFFNYLETEVSPSHVIILSGDVHYSFHATAVLYSTNSGNRFFIDQLTNSALKNSILNKSIMIEIMANLTKLDTKDQTYKKIDERYPFYPYQYDTDGTEKIHFTLRGELVHYDIADEDSWLVYHNTIGLLDISKEQRINAFLHSASFDSPVVKSSRRF